MGERARAVEDVAVNHEFWRGKRVLVTGHTGFKGSWLCLWLQSLGAQVTGYALQPPTTPSLFETARVGDSMRSELGDIRDLSLLVRGMQSAQPDVVFHLAAQPLVLESYTDPVGTYATNVMGTVHLLEAVRQCPSVRAVVNVTTDKCYHNREWLWGYREEDPLGGRDPYSNSKACAEFVTMAYRASFLNPAQYAEHGVAIATTRAGNVIGGGDWAAQRLIPDLLDAFARGITAPLRQPGAIRPWQHVLEPLRGYLMLAERLLLDGPSWGEAWNFGPNEGDAQPVHAVATALAAHWGDGAAWTRGTGVQAAHEAGMLQLSNAKAREQLRWHPALSLDAALERVVFWHKAWRSGHDMHAVTLRQIDEYQSLFLQRLHS